LNPKSNGNHWLLIYDGEEQINYFGVLENTNLNM